MSANKETAPAAHADSEAALPHSNSSASSIDAEARLEKVKTGELPAVEVSRGFKWILIIFAVLSSTFLFALDNTVVADVQADLVEDFGALEKLPWASVAFLLGVIATILFWGRVYGMFNTKWLYISCVVVFETGSALCGGAPNMNAFIVGRAIAGVGGAGMYVGVMSSLSIMTSLQERPLYLSFTGLTWGLGTVLGPIIGGAFAVSSATWRWAFYINLVIGAVFAPVYIFMLPSFEPRPNEGAFKKLKELDWIGLVLMVGLFVSLVMGISMGGQVWAWSSGQSIALFTVAGVLLVIFALQQTFAVLTTPAHRLFPIHFLKSRTLLILFSCTAAAAASLFSPIYFIPLFFQFVRNDSPLMAGVRLLPFIVLLVFFCLLNGGVLSKYGLYWPWYFVGGILVIIGGALMMSLVSQTTSTSEIYGFSILIGVGAGSFVQAGFSVAQGHVSPEEIPAAVGYISLGQSLGATIALAIANSVFLNNSTKRILAVLPSITRGEVSGIISGSNRKLLNSLSAADHSKVLDAIISAMNNTYALVVTAGAVVVVLSLVMKKERLFLEAGGAA